MSLWKPLKSIGLGCARHKIGEFLVSLVSSVPNHWLHHTAKIESPDQ